MLHSVEWQFGHLTNTFAALKYPFGFRLGRQPVGMFYLVATELYNIRTVMTQTSQPSDYFGIKPPTLEEYLAPRAVHVAGGRLADPMVIDEDEWAIAAAGVDAPDPDAAPRHDDAAVVAGYAYHGGVLV